jgi:hypothetical protein
MLIIYVKHFLNEAGKNYFDTWFKECHDYLAKQDGFYSLHRAFDNIHIDTVHIWLHFENREKMALWGESEEHSDIILKLDPYRTQEWQATWYDTDKPCVEHFIVPLGQHNVEKV